MPLSAALAKLSCQFFRSLAIFSRVCSAVSEAEELAEDSSVVVGVKLEETVISVAATEETDERLDDEAAWSEELQEELATVPLCPGPPENL